MGATGATGATGSNGATGPPGPTASAFAEGATTLSGSDSESTVVSFWSRPRDAVGAVMLATS